MITLFFKLLFAHFLADMGLQTGAMAKGKNRHNKPDYVPKGQKIVSVWQYFLMGHAFIHGGLVYLVTGNISLGIFETIAHFLIDFMKCENWTNPHQDQYLHFLCKIFYLFRNTNKL